MSLQTPIYWPRFVRKTKVNWGDLMGYHHPKFLHMIFSCQEGLVVHSSLLVITSYMYFPHESSFLGFLARKKTRCFVNSIFRLILAYAEIIPARQ